ncbi:hypothetical protein pdam_00010333, partial [Pocillopora damicornis]
FKKEPGRGSYTDLVYVKPYCRIAPYLVGIAQGYLIHIEKKNQGKKPSKIPRQVECLVGWFLSIALGVSDVYEDGRPLIKAENMIYGTFSRFVWGLTLAWVIYACNKGYGIMSYAAAFILAIGVEFPTMRLENMFFFRCTKHKVTGLTRATGNQARLRNVDV